MKSKLIIIALLCTSFCYGQNFVPQPNKVEKGNGSFAIMMSTTVTSKSYPELADYLNEHIEKVTSRKLNVVGAHPKSNYILLSIDHNLTDEGYSLDVKPESVTIKGGSRAGLFYGLQTLFQMMPLQVYGSVVGTQNMPLILEAIHIEDAPRFQYRGVMLDVSRTFFDKQTVMNYIDWASRHKINKFHWHLTDDNGWRIEIKSYPELTSKGAWRGPGEVLPESYGSGNKRYGGFYTQQDIRDIVAFAAFRNVEVIPEIDLPGHSQAITATYPETFCQTKEVSFSVNDEIRNVLCAANEDNFKMLDAILKEIATLFPSKYIHIGGDEVNMSYWRNCPNCQALMRKKGFKQTIEIQNYFVKRLEAIVHAHGKTPAGWNEIIKGGTLNKHTLVYGWQDLDVCKESVQKGLKTIVMPGSYMYIDMKQHPDDRGHKWAGLVDLKRVYAFDPTMINVSEKEQELIMGLEAPLWSELLGQPERFIEYQAYPRICAVAEVGWSAAKDRDYSDFCRRLDASHLDRLSAMNIRYRFFPPQVDYKNGRITCSTAWSNSEIRYTSDGSEPNSKSMLYHTTISDSRPEGYRFRAFRNDSWSTPITPSGKFLLDLEPNQVKELSLPLADYIDHDGIWLLRFFPTQSNVLINKLSVIGPDTSYTIIRNGQTASPFSLIRLYADSRNRSANLLITLTNKDVATSEMEISLTASEYVEPAVSVQSSIPINSKFPLSNLADYSDNSYTRTSAPAKVDDYVTYTFAVPEEFAEIAVNTGLSHVTRYIVQGVVEYSADGKDFMKAADLDNGSAVLYPQGKVSAVRIKITQPGNEPVAAFQDLKIKPVRR